MNAPNRPASASCFKAWIRRTSSATVRLIEELGYDYLWLTDSSLHAWNVFSYLTLAAVNSRPGC